MGPVTPEQGAQLRDRRIALGLTQLDVAEKIGVSRGYISQVEKGLTAPPSTKVLSRYSMALEWPRDRIQRILERPTRESTDAIGRAADDVHDYVVRVIDERIAELERRLMRRMDELYLEQQVPKMTHEIDVVLGKQQLRKALKEPRGRAKTVPAPHVDP